MTKPKPTATPVAKGFREAFAQFAADPSRDKLHDLIKNSGGEFRDLDFKLEWPATSSLVKQVLALGNVGGGMLVIGVREEDDGTLTPEGLDAFLDKADVFNALKGYIPEVLLDHVGVGDFDYPTGEYGAVAGKKFQVLIVEPDPDHLPFIARKTGEKIRQGRIYIRRDGGVDEAGYEEIQRILNARIEAGNSTSAEMDLRGHLDQLKVLYGEIQPTKVKPPAWLTVSSDFVAVVENLAGKSVRNPNYPAESYEAFLSSLIKRKQALVERVVGVKGKD